MCIYRIIECLSPYIILAITLIAQTMLKKKDEVPNIKCTIEQSLGFNNDFVIVVIENVGNYNALNFKITPNLEVLAENSISTKQNIICPNDKLKFVLSNNNMMSPIIIDYDDIHKKKHQIEFQINITEKGSLQSNLCGEIKTIIRR